MWVNELFIGHRGSVTMGKRGFSATTFVLVAVLVGALFMVGKTVIPPPPGPPEPPPSAKGTPQQVAAQKSGMNEAQKHHMMDEMKKRQLANKQGYKPPENGKPHKKFDPTQIEISPDWTRGRDMGDKGNQEMEAAVAKAKTEMATKRAMVPRPAVSNSGKESPMSP
jgi:hypothetical protein